MPDSACGICAFFGGAGGASHPPIGSRREEILHCALAGWRPVAIAEATGLDEVYVNGEIRELRKNGLLAEAVERMTGLERKRARRAA